MVKEQIHPQGGVGGGCRAPWDFDQVFQKALSSQRGHTEMAWHMVNINWDLWFKSFKCGSMSLIRHHPKADCTCRFCHWQGSQ